MRLLATRQTDQPIKRLEDPGAHLRECGRRPTAPALAWPGPPGAAGRPRGRPWSTATAPLQGRTGRTQSETGFKSINGDKKLINGLKCGGSSALTDLEAGNPCVSDQQPPPHRHNNSTWQAPSSLAVNWRACMASRQPGGGLAGGGCWPGSLSGRLLTSRSSTLCIGGMQNLHEL